MKNTSINTMLETVQFKLRAAADVTLTSCFSKSAFAPIHAKRIREALQELRAAVRAFVTSGGQTPPATPLATAGGNVLSVTPAGSFIVTPAGGKKRRRFSSERAVALLALWQSRGGAILPEIQTA